MLLEVGLQNARYIPQGDANTLSEGSTVLRFLLPPLIIAAFVLHLWGLEKVPPGAYVDETSIGYNAYAILQTGADEHGVTFPLFFKAFGEYKNPIFIYSLIPLIQIFDLSIWTVRLCAALYGLATCILLGLIVRESIGGKYSWVAGFMLAALTPWLFILSRVGFEVISFNFFLALAWWSWLRAIKSNSVSWFLLSWSAWGIGIFTYTAARLMVPVLVFVLISCYLRELRRNTLHCLIGSIPFALCILLLASWSIQNPGGLTARFEQAGLLRHNTHILTVTYQFVSNYLHYLSPQFLFTKGDPDLRNHTGHGGEIFVFMFPALLAGLAYAWQHRQQAIERFSLIGFILFPLAASLTTDPSHALRASTAIPFVILLVTRGFKQLGEMLSRQRAMLLILGLVAALETGGFYYNYFHYYAGKAALWFNAGLPQALKIVFEERRSHIYYSPLAFRDEEFYVNVPYIQFLFFGKLDPRTFRARGLVGFDIYPYQNGMSLLPGSILLLKDGDVVSIGGKTLVWNNTDLLPPTSALIATVTVPSLGVRNPPTFRIYRIL